MSFFQGASNFSIGGGTFTAVAGGSVSSTAVTSNNSRGGNTVIRSHSTRRPGPDHGPRYFPSDFAPPHHPHPGAATHGGAYGPGAHAAWTYWEDGNGNDFGSHSVFAGAPTYPGYSGEWQQGYSSRGPTSRRSHNMAPPTSPYDSDYYEDSDKDGDESPITYSQNVNSGNTFVSVVRDVGNNYSVNSVNIRRHGNTPSRSRNPFAEFAPQPAPPYSPNEPHVAMFQTSVEANTHGFQEGLSISHNQSRVGHAPRDPTSGNSVVSVVSGVGNDYSVNNYTIDARNPHEHRPRATPESAAPHPVSGARRDTSVPVRREARHPVRVSQQVSPVSAQVSHSQPAPIGATPQRRANTEARSVQTASNDRADLHAEASTKLESSSCQDVPRVTVEAPSPPTQVNPPTSYLATQVPLQTRPSTSSTRATDSLDYPDDSLFSATPLSQVDDNSDSDSEVKSSQDAARGSPTTDSGADRTRSKPRKNMLRSLLGKGNSKGKGKA